MILVLWVGVSGFGDLFVWVLITLLVLLVIGYWFLDAVCDYIALFCDFVLLLLVFGFDCG